MESSVDDGEANSENQAFSASDMQKFSRMMAQFNAFQAQASRSNTNLLQDSSSHFYLHPSETPGISLTDAPLTTSNYHSWSRLATLSLNAKNKLRFIEGTLVKPERDDPSSGAWDRCNTFVLSWLHRSLSPEILQSVLWCNNAYELWMDLKHRFDQGDLFRIADLEEELFSLRQGELTITSYYTKLKSIWEELDEFRPIALCSCLHNCECGKNLEMIREHREQSHVIRFLRGLNDQYVNVRSQLMLVTPLPTVAAAFSSLLQQERQLMHSIDPEARMMANNVNTNAFGTYQNNGSSSIRGRGRGRGGRGKGHGRGTPKLCSHCGKTGHLVDTCYYKHGFPPHMQRNQFKGNTDGPSAMNSVNSITAASNEESSIEPLIQKDERVSLDGLFSDKKKEALFALFQQQCSDPPNNGNLASVHAPSAGTFYLLSISSHILNCHDWILDTGASAHVSFSLDFFQSVKTIKPVQVIMPNGSKVVTTLCGTIFFSASFYLTDVLYIPTFKYNLISISKAADALSCSFLFNAHDCEIQEQLTLKTIGAADQKGGLYTMRIKPVLATAPELMHTIKGDVAKSVPLVHTHNIIHTLDDATLWHHRLGHISCNKIQQMKVAYPFITYHNSDVPCSPVTMQSRNVCLLMKVTPNLKIFLI
ncbi:uncharacterized protein LOC127745435 [Arachis duranensis]|uniref:Uncharacterized protein LOC127745435 n=1 Tax=Arachis duranensis TaxID=130453 RepID=A0A9C6TH95_ARADU|nr:uncharacterized protein LOC127745435 [Arachis duranensis]